MSILETLRRGSWIAIVVIGLAATALRLYRPDRAPPGFHRDEAAVAAQVLCLAQSGRNLDGQHWPLMSPILGGGYSTLAWQLPAVAWLDIAGNSIASMRLFAGFCGAFAVVGVFFFALAATKSKQIAIFSALASAISPWAFQFSRIAWDAAIAPLYLAWALAFLCFSMTQPNAERPWRSWAWLVASAILFAAACLSYPPLRVQVPLVLVGFLVWQRRYVRANLGRAVAFTVVFALCTARMWSLTQSGAIQGRFESLSVFGASYWADRGVTSPLMVLVHGLWLFAKNVVAHFRPTYLFVSGDLNLRHSTQAFGEWSWLDAFALFGVALVLARKKARPNGWMLFASFGYVAGLVPAALTWQGVPHALRSIGALPFLGVLVGTAIVTIGDEIRELRPVLPIAVAIVALGFVLAFGFDFFLRYPERARSAFDAPAVAQLQVGATTRFPRIDGALSRYPLPAIRYYALRSGVERCKSAGPVLAP